MLVPLLVDTTGGAGGGYNLTGTGASIVADEVVAGCAFNGNHEVQTLTTTAAAVGPRFISVSVRRATIHCTGRCRGKLVVELISGLWRQITERVHPFNGDEVRLELTRLPP